MSLIRTALAATALLALPSAPAAAAFGPACPLSGCVFDPAETPYFDFDYTIPADGKLYRWAIDFTAADPLATVSLSTPTQTEIFYTIRAGAGFDELYDGNAPYTFAPTITPGRSVWLVRAPKAFDFCARPGPDGEVCAAVVQIFGNGTFLTVNSTAPITAFFSESAVPEPATWLTLILGFGLTGAAIRRRRLMDLSAPARV